MLKVGEANGILLVVCQSQSGLLQFRLEDWHESGPIYLVLVLISIVIRDRALVEAA